MRFLGIVCAVCVIISSAIVLPSYAKESGINPAQARMELLAADSSFAERARAADVGIAYEEYLADDAMQFPAKGEPVKGKPAIVAEMGEFAKSAALIWTPRGGDVSNDGSMGWTWGTYVITPIGTPPDCALSRGKYLSTWRHTEKGWKMTGDIGNDVGSK
jgi:ketosteroid isomerase-like protein